MHTPVINGIISSEYHEVRGRYDDGSPIYHSGLDIIRPIAERVIPIHSVCPGTLVFKGWENPHNASQGFGNYVIVQDSEKNYHFYGHMEPSSCRHNLYSSISEGHQIGLMGNTGHSTGRHLHYEVRPYPWRHVVPLRMIEIENMLERVVK